ncbi:cupin domain-containing protein [Paenibacillus polymyxa]|nr:cupin domain-containing protein [Paenibacillus polymyxa]
MPIYPNPNREGGDSDIHGTSYVDIFNPGDVWYFPRGYGHSIQGLGPGECHFILIFDNGDFSEDHTFSITDFIAQTPTDVVMQNLGLAADELALLPKKEAYFAKGPVPSIASHDAYPRISSDLITKHRYPLMAKQPR